jgi:TRAP-type mannitol/chloroaromatic compound transport system substrate-binding protein
MIGEILDVVTQLFDFTERLQQATEERRERIVQYFNNIEQCLNRIATELSNNQAPDAAWEELRVYASTLTDIIGREIGQQKAEGLTTLLNRTISNTPIPGDEQHIRTIRNAAGTFKGLTYTIAANPSSSSDSSSPSGISSNNSHHFSRKAFLSTAGGTVIGLTTGWITGMNHSKSSASNTSSSDLFPVVSWKMNTFLSDNVSNTILYQAPEKFCNLIRKMTNGRFEITLDRTGETSEILRKVSEGEIQCGYNAIYYTPKYRSLMFGSAIPFGLNPQEQIVWLSYKKNPNDELTYIQSIYKDKLGLNVIPFTAGTTGGQMGGWFKEKVNSINDLKGKVMRIPGLGAEVFQKLGMTTHDQLGTPISIDESVKRLKEGKFSAVEWTGPYDDIELGLHKAAKFYYYPGWWELGTTADIQVNVEAWKKLPRQYQEIFRTACNQMYINTLAEYEQKNSQALKELSNNGVELVEFSQQILQEAKNETKALLDIYSQQDPIFKEVYDEWNKFKEQIQSWSKLNKMD